MAFLLEGRGNGVKTLCECVDDEKVMFGIMRFSLGSGQFARQKYVFIHINGDKTPPMKRMKHNSQMDDAIKVVGQPIHVTMQFANRYEITSDGIMESMLRLMRVDGGTDYEKTAALMRAEMAKQLDAEPEPEPARARAPSVAADAMSRLKIGGLFDFKSTLLELRKADSVLTFMLVDPEPAEPAVIAAGPGSLPALVEALDDNKVYYALVRLNFGSGRFRRSKVLLMHFIGDTCSPLRRGKWNGRKDELSAMMLDGISAISYTANGIDETDNKTVIDYITSAITKDDGGDSESSFSVEAFMKALEEDNARATAVSEAGDDAAAGGEPVEAARSESLSEVISILHSDEPIYSWMLLSCSK